MLLTRPLDNLVVFNDRKIRINTSFDTVLFALEVFNDPGLLPEDKICLCVDALVKNYKPKRFLHKLSYDSQTKFIDAVFSKLMDNDIPSNNNNKTKVVDFSQDADYIYASFFMDYGIDLIDQQDKLDWRKFIALFNGLSNNTKIKEIINIRQQKIPMPNKYNTDYRNALVQAKRAYALKLNEEERSKNYQSGLKNIFLALKSMAKERDKNGE